MVTINSINRDYQRCIEAAKTALRFLREAERNLGKAWEQETDEFAGVIEDMEIKIKWLERQYKS